MRVDRVEEVGLKEWLFYGLRWIQGLAVEVEGVEICTEFEVKASG